MVVCDNHQYYILRKTGSGQDIATYAGVKRQDSFAGGRSNVVMCASSTAVVPLVHDLVTSPHLHPFAMAHSVRSMPYQACIEYCRREGELYAGTTMGKQ